MRHDDETITSVGAMLQALNQQTDPKQSVWFRGHAKKSWGLVPGLARNKKNLKAESALIKRFMQNAAPHLRSVPTAEWEWLFLMQHHRAFTRLLDWTESPLVALYFAVTGQSHRSSDGCVWSLDPIALNTAAKLKFSFSAEIPAFGIDNELSSYLLSHVREKPPPLPPVGIVGPRSTPRMVAQLGTFTINHRDHTPIERLADQQHVWRWVVPADAKVEIVKELARLGLTKLTLFPELDSVADLAQELLKG